VLSTRAERSVGVASREAHRFVVIEIAVLAARYVFVRGERALQIASRTLRANAASARRK
jgi:hypothetical protein